MRTTTTPDALPTGTRARPSDLDRDDLPLRGAYGPSPLSVNPKPEAIERHRSLWCTGYDACLDVAMRSGWSSWTCQACPAFLRSAPSRSQFTLQAFGHQRRAQTEASLPGFVR